MEKNILMAFLWMVYSMGRESGHIIFMMNDIKASGRTTNHPERAHMSGGQVQNTKVNLWKENNSF